MRIQKKQSGVSMLEVLISVLILAIGLIGLSGLQMKGLKVGNSSIQRSQVVLLSYSMLDMLRVDRSNAQTGNYNFNKLCTVPVSAANITERSQQLWLQSLKDSIGDSACGEIVCNTNSCTVSVYWDDSKAEGSVNQVLSSVTHL